MTNNNTEIVRMDKKGFREWFKTNFWKRTISSDKDSMNEAKINRKDINNALDNILDYALDETRWYDEEGTIQITLAAEIGLDDNTVEGKAAWNDMVNEWIDNGFSNNCWPFVPTVNMLSSITYGLKNTRKINILAL